VGLSVSGVIINKRIANHSSYNQDNAGTCYIERFLHLIININSCDFMLIHSTAITYFTESWFMSLRLGRDQPHVFVALKQIRRILITKLTWMILIKKHKCHRQKWRLNNENTAGPGLPRRLPQWWAQRRFGRSGRVYFCWIEGLVWINLPTTHWHFVHINLDSQWFSRILWTHLVIFGIIWRFICRFPSLVGLQPHFLWYVYT
jgi:hypothetical protein